MKILHVVHGYPPSVGGSQELIKNLSEKLVANYQANVTVFTTVAYQMEHFWGQDEQVMAAGTELINGVTVRRFKVFNRLNGIRKFMAAVTTRLNLPTNDYWRTLHNGPIIFGLKQAIACHGADVILAMAFPLRHMYDALVGARRAEVPIVFIGAIHADDRWGYEREMMYQAIRAADGYIALTPFEKNYLVERGIEADKIAVIGGGVEADIYALGDGQAVKARLGLASSPVIVTLGKHSPRKRFDTVLAAMPQVWADFPETRLLIAGTQGAYSDQLRALIAALPAEARHKVVLVNDLTAADKPALLSACDLFVLASGHESFGIVFVEAWACGKPVIGAGVGAVASLITAGQDGLLFDYDNPPDLAQKINQLLTDPAQRRKMGEAGRQKVLENYTWDVIAARMYQLYVDLTARR